MSNRIQDKESEKNLLACVLKHGAESFYGITSIINEGDFSLPEHQLLFGAFKDLIEKDEVKKPDVALVCQKINKINPVLVGKYQITDYLSELSNTHIEIDHSIIYAKNVARASLVNTLHNKLGLAQSNLLNTSFDRPILDIVAETEKIIFDFNSKLLNGESATVELSNTIEDYFDFLSKNKRSRLGIPTGFPRYDNAIGGGIRSPGVAVMGARSGVGKTTWAVNVAINVASQDIPVLYLDTEMTQELIQSKLMSVVSDTKIFEVESGGFENDRMKFERIQRGVKQLKGLPIHYHNVSGLTHSQIISLSRKWIHKVIGFDENGNTKPCLIILDYIKTMDTGQLKNIQEYQYLGQYLTDLHNFTIEYNIPMLAMVQLNRDGINKDDSGVVSGSDRILWLCTSLSFIKMKTEEDLVSDPIMNGDRKIIVNKARFGGGLQFNEYINIVSDLSKCQMKEGQSNIENKLNQGTVATLQNQNPKPIEKKQPPKTLIVDKDEEDRIPF